MRVYRASSLGYSLEQLVAPHLGYEPVSPPEWMQEKFDEGKRIEPLAIKKLEELGWEIQTTQAEENSVGDYQIEVAIEVIPGEVQIVGHLDGITTLPFVNESRLSYVVEVKRMYAKGWEQFKKSGWDTPGLIQKYKWQASAYMIATGLPHILVAWNADTEELAYAVTLTPFYTVEVLANKVLAAEQAIRDGVLPEGCTDFPCPYFYLHADKEAVPVEEADDELEELLSAWLQMDNLAKSYEADKKRIREKILALAGEDSVGKIRGSNGVTVTTTWIEAKEVNYTTKPHWETRIQGPRK